MLRHFKRFIYGLAFCGVVGSMVFAVDYAEKHIEILLSLLVVAAVFVIYIFGALIDVFFGGDDVHDN